MAITTYAVCTDSVEAEGEDVDIFCIALVGIFVAELTIEKGIVKMPYGYVDFFKKRRVLETGICRSILYGFFLSRHNGFAWFWRRVRLTLANINKSFGLVLSFGLPFAVFYSIVAYLFIKERML